MSDITEDFKNGIKEWINIDDREKELKAQLKVLGKKKQELSEIILKDMEKNDIDDLTLSTGGKLKASVSVTTAPLKKEFVFNSLVNELKDEVKAQYLTNKLYDKESRGTVSKVSLKRYKK